MAVSFVAGGRALGLLRAEVTFPEEILAADPTSLILTLHNPSSRRYSAAASARLRAGGQRLPGVRFGSLAPGGSATRFVPTRFPWRGLVRGVRLALETTDPFGLVRRRRHLRIRGEFFVYPAPSPPGEVDDLGRHGRGDLPARRIGEGIELHQIRRYQLEDESRHIDWRATARLGEVMVKEFLEERAEHLVIVFDPAVATLNAPTRSRFEQQVSLATALVIRCCERRTPLGFIAPDREFREIDPPGGHRPVLEYLATVQPAVGMAASLAPELEGMPGLVRLGGPA